MRGTVLVVLVLALAACGGEEESRPAAGTPAPGGGLTVQEALDSDVDGPLLVRGYLLRRGGETRLCTALAESDPPQCGEPSLRVEGEAPTRPVGEEVSLLGDVRGDVLRVSETSIAQSP